MIGASITIESNRDLTGLRRAGRVVALAPREMRTTLEPGMTTADLDAVGVVTKRSSIVLTAA